MGFVIHWNESDMGLHVFPIPIPPPSSLSIRSLWVFPVHQVWALVSCIQPGLVICFTLDNIHVSMLFSWNIPPSPSPTESKSLFYTSVSLLLFCILGYLYHLSKFHIYVLVYCNGLYLSGLFHSLFRCSDERREQRGAVLFPFSDPWPLYNISERDKNKKRGREGGEKGRKEDRKERRKWAS